MIRNLLNILSVLVVILSAWTCKPHNSKVDGIINKHMAAIGGKDNLQAIHAMKLTGKYYLNGLEYPLTIFRKRPNLLRVEISINDKKAIAGFNGETAWEINELQSSEATEIEDLRSKYFVERNAEFDGALINWEQKGHQIAFVGKEDVDGDETYLLKVTLRDGRTENWYIDSSTFTVLKRTAKMPHPYEEDADEIEQVFLYMDYDRVEGLLIPFYTEREDMQYVREYVIESVEMNPEIGDDIFKVLLKSSEEVDS